MGAVKYCMVTATRGPSARDLDTICEAVRQIKAEMNINVCTSLGLLKDGQAEQLAAAGVTRFNHNLESSPGAFFPKSAAPTAGTIAIATVQRAQARRGSRPAAAASWGWVRREDDRISLAFELQALEVESIPVNFLDPRPGTPMGATERLAPHGLPARCWRCSAS